MSEVFRKYLEMIKRFNEVTSQERINPTEAKVLMALYDAKAISTKTGLTLGKIMDRVKDGYSWSTYSVAVTGLEKEGYIKKSVGEEDERQRVLCLTPKGVENCKTLEGKL